MTVSSIQLLSLIFAVLSIPLIVSWAIQNTDKWLYSVPVLTWLVHVIIFYMFFLLNDMTEFHHKWSAYVRLHGVFNCFISVFIIAHFDTKITKAFRKSWNKLSLL